MGEYVYSTTRQLDVGRPAVCGLAIMTMDPRSTMHTLLLVAGVACRLCF